jgi:hypothetical protein
LYNDENRVSDFYAESWALTHMLLMGRPSRVNELSSYLQQVNNGVDEKQAWEQALGTSRTENEFRLYVTRPTMMTGVIDFPEKVGIGAIAEVPLSPAAATAFQAGLLLHHNADGAAKLLEPHLARDPVEPLSAVTMAEIDIARRDPTNATKRIMALGAISDWFAQYSAASTLLRVAAFESHTDTTSQAIARATTLLGEVRRTHTELPNVLAWLARAEMLGDSPPSSVAQANIARARALAPGRVDYALTQAELFAQSRDFTRARGVIGPLMTPIYPEEVRSAARRLMGELVQIQQQIETGATSRTRSLAIPDANADKPRTNTSGSKFRPAYRALKPDEQRLEGTLEAIDCPAGKPAVFRVRTSLDVVELEGRMAEVEFVTFRDDLTGGVSCGPRAPMRVYVSWREGTSPRREKVVVAVEFLPKD